MATLWLIIGTLGFIGATVLFLYWATSAPAGTRHFYIITAVITGVAAFSYLMMSVGAGYTLVGGDRLFYFFRYIDWLITTPLLLLDLALLALPNWRRNIGLILVLIVLDVLMILTGLLAGLAESGAVRGFLFIVSTVFFVALIYLLVTQLFAAARNASGGAQTLFNTLAYLTIALWALYPIAWLLGTEGFGAVGTGAEVFIFLILDFLAKIGFGVLLLTSRQALLEATGGGAAARPSRVR